MRESDVSTRQVQRRYVTVLFSDLCESTNLAASGDPEDYAELLQQLDQTFERVIIRHGGSLLQVMGDGVFAEFGFEPHEDSGRRAASAALDLHEAVRNIRFATPADRERPVRLHSGIHSGLVLAIEGDQLRGRFALVGDAANLAAHLSDMAQRDEILASSDSLGTDRHFFETGTPRDIRFDSSDAPMTVYPVLGHSSIGTRYEARVAGSRSPMMGRERELNTLRRAYQLCLEGSGQVISVVASPGTGKTRLIEEFLGELDPGECRILKGTCEGYLDAEPLQPLRQMLRQVLALPTPLLVTTGSIESLLAERLEALHPTLVSHVQTLVAILAPSPDGVSPSESAIAEAIFDLARHLCSDHPLVLFVDDWQWADDATRGALRNTMAMGPARLMFICASRKSIPEWSDASFLDLQPLDSSHSEAMIETLLPTADRVVVEQISTASGGNPLFIEELCHAVTHGVAMPELQGRWHAAQIPTHVSALIVSRVALLEADPLHLLQHLAVLGNQVPPWLLQRVVDIDAAKSAIEELQQLDLVHPGEEPGSLRFKHGIVREVVLESMDRAERRALHHRVALVLESSYTDTRRESVLELLAFHFGETSDHAKAADYAEAAADKSLAVGAIDRVRMLLQAALHAMDQMDDADVYPRWVGAARRLGLACLFDSEPSQCEIYRRWVQLARARGELANETESHYWLASINYALGNAEEAIEHVQQAIRLLESPGNDALRTQILALSGQIHANACDYARAMPLLDEALSLQAQYRNRPRISAAYAYSMAAKAMVLGDRGQFDEAFSCMEEAAQLIKGPIHPVQGSITSMRTAIYLWQGRWEEALEWADRNVDIGNRMGSRYISAMGIAMRGYARWRLDPDADTEALSRALAWLETSHQAIWTSLHFAWLCEILISRERYQDVEHAAAWVSNRARKRDRLGESVLYCALACIPPDMPGHQSPEQCFARARESASARDSPREHALIDFREAALLARHGETDRAIKSLDGVRERFSGMGMYGYAAEAQRLERGLHDL